jgi:hypothetical protein
MSSNRILYRTRQFWQALGSAPACEDMQLVRSLLTPQEQKLFERLQPGEKTHSVRVLRALMEQDENNRDLLTAALLHDVGKSRFPLRIWERVLVVLLKFIAPGWVQRWGSLNPLGSQNHVRGWRRPFIIAEQHPRWGAEMAVEAGVNPLVSSLIQRHQETLDESPGENLPLAERLLRKLQAVDDHY